MAEKTEWFSVSVKPVRKGWYEANYEGTEKEGAYALRHFDGEDWRTPSGGRYAFSNNPLDKWRGLTEQAQ